MNLLGTAQRDITPKSGVELTGFLGRDQPATGQQDSLFARALYLEQGDQRLLWIHVDLLGLNREFVQHFREWANHKLNIPPGNVMLTATHTHGGPAVVRLLGCGRYEEAYVASLRPCLEELVVEAIASVRPVRLVVAGGTLELAVDRRRKNTSITDPHLTAVGWRAQDGSFAAATLVYSMHPVAMGKASLITADWPGRAAKTLQGLLPGNPVALVSSGACGNLNPPKCGTTQNDMHTWGDQVAELGASLLMAAQPSPESLTFRVASRVVDLPLEVWDAAEIEQRVAAWTKDVVGTQPHNQRHREVLEQWRVNRLRDLGQPDHERLETEVMAFRLGPLVLLGVNAEVFCQFTLQIRERTGRDVATLGCANGVFGYLSHDAAYDEGGYEPNSSFQFYDRFRLKRGSLEFLSNQAVELIDELFA